MANYRELMGSIGMAVDAASPTPSATTTMRANPRVQRSLPLVFDPLMYDSTVFCNIF